MKMYFAKNSVQVLDSFSCLLAERMSEGKRCLLIAKKWAAPFCAAEMEHRLRAMGHSRCRVLYEDMNEVVLQDSEVVPLIHYGVIGVNSFEEFDCAFCLTGYYVYEEVVNSILQDVLASDIAVPIRIKTIGEPRRRWAGGSGPKAPLHRCSPTRSSSLAPAGIGHGDTGRWQGAPLYQTPRDHHLPVRFPPGLAL